KETDAHGALLQIRGGRMIAVRHYHLQNTDPSLPDAELLFDFLAQYYLAGETAAEASEGGPGKPSQVLVAESPRDPELLERTLGVGVLVPESETERQLLNVARANAEYALEQS